MRTNKMIAAELRRIADFLDRRETETTPCTIELTNTDDLKQMRFKDFCEKYFKVRSHVRIAENEWDMVSVPLKLYEFQERFVEAISRHRFVIAKKPRQMGFSTVATLWMTQQAMLFGKGERYGIMCKTDRECLYCGEYAKFAIENMPAFARPELDINNHHEIKFSRTQSSINFMTPESACGKAFGFLYLDEPAFWKNAKSHWEAIYPTIATNGHCIIMSTPNGKGTKESPNWFYDTYQRSLAGKNDFEIYSSSYTEHPEYQKPEWAVATKENLGEKGWRQEVLQEFLD